MKTYEYRTCDRILRDYLSNFNYIATHEKTNPKILSDYLIANRSILSMSRLERAIFAENYMHGLTIAEIAEKMALSERAVQYHKRRLIDKVYLEIKREKIRG